MISPLDVNFSQAHIRPEFQDDAGDVENASELVTAEYKEGPPPSPLASDKVGLEVDAQEKGGGAPAEDPDGWYLLKAPFPEIETIQWRCKLRMPDGSIKVDSIGVELYGDKEWYSLDNRRLFCLQKAALKLWPRPARVWVYEVSQKDRCCREFRKFKTTDCGRSIAIGHRDNLDLPRWSWRKEVGLPDEEMPEGTPMIKQPKRRSFDSRYGPPNGRNARYRDQGGPPDQGWDIPRNVLLFVLVYAVLRAVLNMSRKYFGHSLNGASAINATVEAVNATLSGGAEL